MHYIYSHAKNRGQILQNEVVGSFFVVKLRSSFFSRISLPISFIFGMVLLTGTEIICVKFQVHILAGSGDIQLEEGPYQALY